MADKLTDEEYKQRNAELAVLVKKFEDALQEAEDFATKHGLEFSIYPAYGMGGWFDGENNEGWQASSQQGC